ncbi:hypothetical protein HMPREF9166_1423 [Selenomonas sp. oral taxon 149 str. 67H29BP]|nr:hypothetical protein HMPREF9166_1423 [Selenomonas sp. oral taxon 149 str. 67H29BP]
MVFPLIISASIYSTTKIPPRKGNSPFFVEITKESRFCVKESLIK